MATRPRGAGAGVLRACGAESTVAVCGTGGDGEGWDMCLGHQATVTAPGSQSQVGKCHPTGRAALELKGLERWLQSITGL